MLTSYEGQRAESLWIFLRINSFQAKIFSNRFSFSLVHFQSFIMLRSIGFFLFSAYS